MTDAPRPGDLELRVLSGLHFGAAIPLLGDQLDVGSDPACDVLLLDQGIQPVHWQLRRVDGVWREAEAPGALPLETPLPVGAAWVGFYPSDAAWPDDSDVAADATPSAPATAADAPASASGAPHKLRYGVAFLLGCTVALQLKVYWPELLLPSAAASQLAAPPKSSPPPLPPPPAPQLTLDDARAMTTSVLDELGLTDVVTVSDADDSAGQEALALAGELSAEQLAALEQALKPVRRQVRPLQIAVHALGTDCDLESRMDAVVIGPVPFVSLRDGGRAFEGDVCGRYRIAGIEAHRILLHGARELEIRW